MTVSANLTTTGHHISTGDILDFDLKLKGKAVHLMIQGILKAIGQYPENRSCKCQLKRLRKKVLTKCKEVFNVI